MTSRERVTLALNHRRPDRVPIDLGGSRVTGISVFAYHDLCRHAGLPEEPPRVYDVFQMLAEVQEPFRQRFHVDTVPVPQLRPEYGLRMDRWRPWRLWDGTEVMMPAEFSPEEDPSGDLLIRDARDPGGPYVARMPRGGYYFDTIGQTTMSAELTLPDPARHAASLRPLDDEALEFAARRSRELHQSTDYALIGEFWAGGLGLPLSFGDQMLALATEPTWCAEILEALADSAIQSARLYKQAVGERCVAWLVSGYDYGTQRGELFRPELFAELFAPNFKRINDWIHQSTGAKTFYHSCGSNRALLPIFVEMGVDIFNPVQVTARNMAAAELAREFAGKLVFWGGGADTQSTLPHGTPEEVVAQALERCRTFGPDGGFVFNPIHNVQAKTPPRNLAAMLDAVHEQAGYPLS